MATLPPPPPPSKTGDAKIDTYLQTLYKWAYLMWFYQTSSGTDATGAEIGGSVAFMFGIDGEDGEDGLTIVGPQGPPGLPGLTIPGMDGQEADDNFIPGPSGRDGRDGRDGIPGMDGEDAADYSFYTLPTGAYDAYGSVVAHAALTATHGTVGAIVGTTDAQALTNKSYNGNTWTAGTGTLTLGAGKTLAASNTLTFTATDGATLAIGAGGTLGTAAYTASTAYEAAGGIATHAALTTTHGVSGALVGTTDTQELAAKTLNASVAKGTWTSSGTWTLPALTLGGTISGGGNQINNVVIGTVTPLAGYFTKLGIGTGSPETIVDFGTMPSGDGFRLGQVDAGLGTTYKYYGLNDLGGAGSWAGGAWSRITGDNSGNYWFEWQTQYNGIGNFTMSLSKEGHFATQATIATGGYTVAALPAGTIGMRAYVTDALAPAYGAAVVGGGAVVIPVFRNATVWICA